VYEEVLQELTHEIANHAASKNQQKVFAILTRSLERDGFWYRDGKLTQTGLPNLDSLGVAVMNLDAPELHRQLQRLRDSPDDENGLHAVGLLTRSSEVGI
jgi:hypothetical protein